LKLGHIIFIARETASGFCSLEAVLASASGENRHSLGLWHKRLDTQLCFGAALNMLTKGRSVPVRRVANLVLK
jgi:hypothetical protein